ncbi:hypothetical protein TNCV_3559601 [Trichonephila clavipes]|uniref:Uncharacterized protein n=1 Tax=Trichonephila clavipes TaxID=2585209 RepID=A0A8X6WCH1_TRICX|nr:hypothetical protein TNCV_3559601 [Trichonephila clavipes]
MIKIWCSMNEERELYSASQLCNQPHTSVHHDHSQTADRVKLTLVLTAMLTATHACKLSSQITEVLGSIRLESCLLGREEYRFQLCPGVHRRRVWRRPGQHADTAFTIARHTDP